MNLSTMQKDRTPIHWMNDVLVFAIIFLGSGAYSLFRGQDANWDLKNYHFYNAFAFVNDRMNLDVAPASLQSYLNPLLDLPFYYLVGFLNESPRVISFLMVLPSAIALFLLLKVLGEVFDDRQANRRIAVFFSFAVGICGAAGIALWGTTMNEWPVAAIDMIAVLILVRTLRNGSWQLPAIGAAGLLAGIAAGFKLTAATYCVGLFVAILSTDRNFVSNMKWAICFGAFVILGVALAGGPWMLKLYREFDNPMFPLFNDFFRSPWYEPASIRLDQFVPKSWQDVVLFPFRMLEKNKILGEGQFRDWHLPYLYAAAALAAGKAAYGRLRRPATSSVPSMSRLDHFLLAYVLVSYVVWYALHANIRYQIQIELLSGCVLVILLRFVFPQRRMYVLLLTLLLMLWVTKLNPSWGRIAFGERYFDVQVPDMPSNSLVLLAAPGPVAYLAPFFAPSTKVAAINSHLIQPLSHHLLRKRVDALIETQKSPIYIVGCACNGHPDAYLAYGLKVVTGDCRMIRSNFDQDGLTLCRAERNTQAAIQQEPP